jgi:hypothetical protein
LRPREKPLVSVVVLNYNGKDVLRSCLTSVLASAYRPIEIILVDNNSVDGSELISLPGLNEGNFRLVKSSKNLGYSGGNNLGIRATHGEYVVLLNNDTIIDPNLFSELVAAAEKGGDFFQPKILLNDGKTINSEGLNIHVAGFGLLRRLGEVDGHLDEDEVRLSGCHGACLFASKRALNDVGLLDEAFFAFNEDTDMSWRALLKGLTIVYVPSAKVTHKWSQSFNFKSPFKIKLLERNRLIMILTNYSARSLVLLSPIILTTELATLSYCMQDRRLLSAKVSAYAELLLMRRYILNRRRVIQGQRRVPDKELIGKFEIEFQQQFITNRTDVLNRLYKLLWQTISESF